MFHKLIPGSNNSGKDVDVQCKFISKFSIISEPGLGVLMPNHSPSFILICLTKSAKSIFIQPFKSYTFPRFKTIKTINSKMSKQNIKQ